MGYSTDYNGTLTVPENTTIEELNEIDSIIDGSGERWDLEVTYKKKGIEWNGCEKTYDLEEGVNIIIEHMREYTKNPQWTFSGEMEIQGEEGSDRGVFKKQENGLYKREDLVLSSEEIYCPHCNELINLKEISDEDRKSGRK